MTVPNTLTLGRIALAPVFLTVFMARLTAPRVWNAIAAAAIFFLGELTDLLDGILARRLRQTSELGKLLDPFADVVSRLTYFLALLLADVLPLWFFAVVLYRELGITFWRLYLVQSDIVLGANLGGKTKAWLYFGVSAIGLFGWLGLPWGLGWKWEGLLLWLWNAYLAVTAGVSTGTFVQYVYLGIRRWRIKTSP